MILEYINKGKESSVPSPPSCSKRFQFFKGFIPPRYQNHCLNSLICIFTLSLSVKYISRWTHAYIYKYTCKYIVYIVDITYHQLEREISFRTYMKEGSYFSQQHLKFSYRSNRCIKKLILKINRLIILKKKKILNSAV